MVVPVFMTEKMQEGENAGPPLAFFFFFLYSTEAPSSGIGAAHIQGGSHLGTPSLIHSGRIGGGRKRGMENGKRKDGERKRRREKPRLTNCLGDLKSSLVDNGAYPS